MALRLWMAAKGFTVGLFATRLADAVGFRGRRLGFRV